MTFARAAIAEPNSLADQQLEESRTLVVHPRVEPHRNTALAIGGGALAVAGVATIILSGVLIASLHTSCQYSSASDFSAISQNTLCAAESGAVAVGYTIGGIGIANGIAAIPLGVWMTYSGLRPVHSVALSPFGLVGRF